MGDIGESTDPQAKIQGEVNLLGLLCYVYSFVSGALQSL